MPGTRQNCSLALFTNDKKPKAESGTVLSWNRGWCHLEPRLHLLGWGYWMTRHRLVFAAPVPCPVLALLLASSSSLSTCCWQSNAGGLPMGGHYLLLRAAFSLLFVKAVFHGSTAWCFSQRMTFMKAVAWGCAVGAAGPRARRERRRSGYSGRWNLAQGGYQVPSSICLFPFNLLLSRTDQLEL